MTDGGQSDTETYHIPHSSADDIEYVDERGIRIFKSNWECPNCGDEGELMYRPGSKSTCAKCFWVVNGQYNDFVLADWPLKYRDAQHLLAELGDDWYGTPGDIGTRLRKHFDRPEEAAAKMQELKKNARAVTDGGDRPTTLGDFS